MYRHFSYNQKLALKSVNKAMFIILISLEENTQRTGLEQLLHCMFLHIPTYISVAIDNQYIKAP